MKVAWVAYCPNPLPPPITLQDLTSDPFFFFFKVERGAEIVRKTIVWKLGSTEEKSQAMSDYISSVIIHCSYGSSKQGFP